MKVKSKNQEKAQTYILKCISKENNIYYYCGATNNFNLRLKYHLLKRNVSEYFIIDGDYEFKIKLIRVKNMYVILKQFSEPVLRDSEGIP